MVKPGIIIIDDHQLFRNGLKHILVESGKYQVIGEASDGSELQDLLEKVSPDLVILDIRMPVMDGIEAARQSLHKYPGLKILILSMFGDAEYCAALMDLGIKGFILKNADTDEFFMAIGKILGGGTFFSQDLLLKMIQRNTSRHSVKLSRRETEILGLIGKGCSNLEISAMLAISQRTVERHRTSLLEKTGSKNAVMLIIYALKNALISLEDFENRR